jgi:F0F1-type ATP synthase gamma subunit
VERVFVGFADRPEFSNTRDVAATVAAPFIAGEARDGDVGLDALQVGRQVRPSRRAELLPLSVDEKVEVSGALKGYTEFEPEVEQLLGDLAPKALESEIFTALLEGAACVPHLQQRAMAAATDNADELSRNLTRVMNRAVRTRSQRKSWKLWAVPKRSAREVITRSTMAPEKTALETGRVVAIAGPVIDVEFPPHGSNT